MGASLQRTNTDGPGNDPDSWIGAAPTPGRGIVVNADFNDDGNIDDLDIDLVAAAIR